MRWYLAAAFIALQCAAQDLPRPIMSAETRGRVVDESGAPVEGAVVVARWNWLRYRAALEGSGYYPSGYAIHIGEAVSDREGRYAIAGWGPRLQIDGRLEEGAPLMLAFKSGYEPSTGHEANVRLRKAGADAKANAQRIRHFQDVPLVWQYPEDQWKSYPRMVAALQHEKARLGADGEAIKGAYTLAGRTGAGRILDSQTGQPIQQAVLAIAWTLRRADGGPGSRRFVQTKRAGTDHGDISFYVSPLRLPGPSVPGWEIDPAVEPDVTIYAAGYRVNGSPRWSGAGGTIRMHRLPEGRDATLENLRAWRRDIDREIEKGERMTALDGQRALLSEFAYRCRDFTPDLQKGLCFEPQSDVGQFIERSRTITSQIVDTMEGTREIRVVAMPAPTPQAARVGVAAAGYPGQRIPVSGFSIEPAK
ncbi:MAG: carboxypeptidase regulatory-like domain-containing protein [Burkholderiales bacterium]|nr:carboxypeptidase regulatory-like domain-containing protein [Burkholderiales bacterium]